MNKDETSLKVSQVANRILLLGLKNDISITNMSLQKLIYFSVGFYHMFSNKMLIDTNIEAWKFGPVSPEVYHEFKSYGKDPITRLSCVYSPEMDSPTTPDINVATHQLASQVVNATFTLLGGEDPFTLVENSHDPKGPWYRVFKPNSNNIITFEEKDKEYFLSLWKLLADAQENIDC